VGEEREMAGRKQLWREGMALSRSLSLGGVYEGRR